MGSSRWDSSTYSAYSSSTTGIGADARFTTKSLHEFKTKTLDPKGHTKLDPKGILFRESRDSIENPESTPIIIGLDVTGSMGIVADAIAGEKLGPLFSELYERKPVTDPHIMFMGIGDACCDSAPLQVSQFEAGPQIIEQLTNLWLEKGGGGNNFESYNLPWYFAAHHTITDAFEKRGRKGYLFTIGDECFPEDLTNAQIGEFIGDEAPLGLSNDELLASCERMYNVFHIIVEQGSYARHSFDKVLTSWTKQLGQRVLRLSDYNKIAEVIVSAIQINEGADKETVSKSWSGDTAMVVARATEGLIVGDRGGAVATTGGVARF